MSGRRSGTKRLTQKLKPSIGWVTKGEKVFNRGLTKDARGRKEGQAQTGRRGTKKHELDVPKIRTNPKNS